MKTIVPIICAIVTTSALTAHAQTPFSGSTYEVEITRDNGSVTKRCMTFNESGRFTISDEALAMQWAPQVNYPNQFMAVSAASDRTVATYHAGVYGTVLPDNTVTGHGFDRRGNAFVFSGKSADACDASRTERVTGNTQQTAIDLTGLPSAAVPVPGPCWFPNDAHVPCNPILDPLREPVSPVQDQALIPIADPCWSPAGSHVPCDPIPDPTGYNTNSVTTPTLTGSSFRLTLGTSDQTVLEYCWTFGETRQIETATGGLLAWSSISRADDVAGFQSVGTDARGRSMAYHGALVGAELLEVVGIEARDDESVVTYGYGQQVAGCE